MTISKILAVGSLASLLIGAPVFASQDDGREVAKEVRKEKIAAVTLDRACVVTALTKREDTLMTALTNVTKTRTEILTKRKTALIAAWGIEDKTARQTAVKDASKAFATEKRAAQETYRKATKTAWETFKTERRACGQKSELENTAQDSL